MGSATWRHPSSFITPAGCQTSTSSGLQGHFRSRRRIKIRPRASPAVAQSGRSGNASTAAFSSPRIGASPVVHAGATVNRGCMRSLVRGGCHCVEKTMGLRLDAARSDAFKLFGLAQCQGSFTRASRRAPRAHFCILVPSDDRRIHGCGPEIPADSSTRVQTPASALMHGSCWAC